jgi:hypothetical protein
MSADAPISMNWTENMRHTVPRMEPRLTVDEFMHAHVLFSAYFEMDLVGVEDVTTLIRPPIRHLHMGHGRPFYYRCLTCHDMYWKDYIDPTTVSSDDPRVAMLGHCECLCCRRCVMAETEVDGWRQCPMCDCRKSHSTDYPLWPFPMEQYRALLERTKAKMTA